MLLSLTGIHLFLAG